MLPSPYLLSTLIKLPGHSRPLIRVTKGTVLSGGLAGSLKLHETCFAAPVSCPSETLEAHGDADSRSPGKLPAETDRLSLWPTVMENAVVEASAAPAVTASASTVSSSVGRITGRALGRTVQTTPRQRLLDAPPQAVQGRRGLPCGSGGERCVRRRCAGLGIACTGQRFCDRHRLAVYLGATQEPHHRDALG